MIKIIQDNYSIFRIHCKEVNIAEAKKAIKMGRVLLARFDLKGYQWRNFSKFYEDNK